MRYEEQFYRKVKLIELNVVRKSFRKASLRVALCYPNVYRVGMSSLAIHIIYSLLNSYKDVLCERCFFTGRKIEPRTIEGNRSLREFDIILFSISYEKDIINIITMLKNAGIPPLRRTREGRGYPIIGAGGVVVMENPVILEEFMDILFIGDAEAILPKVIDVLISNNDKKKALEDLIEIEGVYIPKYASHYKEVRRSLALNLNSTPYPVRQVMFIKGPSELTPIYGRAYLMEISRGCPYWCRFCLLGYLCKPYRIRSLNRVMDILSQGMSMVRPSGIEKVVLISSAIGNYPKLEELLFWLVKDQKLKISIPSMRIDKMTYEMAELIRLGGQRTITFAPETGSKRIMNMIGKGITFDDIIEVAKTCRKVGFNNVKLYFIIGFPSEKEEDVRAIAELIKRIVEVGYSMREAVRVTVTPLIPKPHTPFQWLPMDDIKSIEKKIKLLRGLLGNDSRIRLSIYNINDALIQAIISKGDKNLSKALLKVEDLGGDMRAWKSVIRSMGLERYAYRRISLDEKLPWDIVNTGIPKYALKRLYELSVSELSG